MPPKGPNLRMLLLAILAVALLLRLPGLTDRGPWLDERVSLIGALGLPYDSASSASGASTTPQELWTANSGGHVIRANQVNNGANAVVYQLLLHAWMRVFGATDASARSLSLTFGLGVLILAYYLGRDVAGDLAGALASLFCAMHPMLIRYSQEIRPYAMVTFLALAATLLLLRALAGDRHPKQRGLWIGYGVVVAVALPSHLLVLPLLAGHFILVCFAGQRDRWRSYLGALALTTVLLLPWAITCVPAGLADLAARSAFYREQALAGNPEYWWVHPATPKYLVGGSLGASLAMFGYVIPAPRVALSALALVIPGVVLLLASKQRPPSGGGSVPAQAGTRVPTRSVGGGGGATRLQPVADTANDLISGVPASTQANGTAWKLLIPGLAGLPFACLSALRAGHDLPFQTFYFNFYVPLLMVALAAAWLALWQQRVAFVYRLAPVHVALVAVSLASSLPAIFHDRRPNVYSSVVRAIRQTPQVHTVEVPFWSDAQMLAFYLGPSASPRLRVTGDEEAGVVLVSSSGTLPSRLHIDRKAAH